MKNEKEILPGTFVRSYDQNLDRRKGYRNIQRREPPWDPTGYEGLHRLLTH